ncbi:helix-turn-helix transcriptional regulator [Gordonia westfalica]|uniref:DNA binding domain-containing protein, excisionase family n=1 Tax=Gordonia westfalica TaxID=158898 RepID=A0A1H2KPJ0_9ACTN|nr:helix-turn-helix domain-containing protein [Gordonia westfalica]SDU70597.1 DNA binding domain-containing protein, excisionase family [Gordonia westfalica]
MTAQASTTDVLLTAKTAAQRLSVGVQTLAKWRSEKKGPRYVLLGRSIRYRTSDIDEFIERSITETA